MEPAQRGNRLNPQRPSADQGISGTFPGKPMMNWLPFRPAIILSLAASLLAAPAYADKALKMPPCDPGAIPGDAVPYLKLPPATKSVSIELTYRDGSVSEIKSFRRQSVFKRSGCRFA
jgi:hypothetical protein